MEGVLPRLQEDRVDHSEHGGVHSDSEGDSQDSSGREQRTAAEGTKGKAHSVQHTCGMLLRFRVPAGRTQYLNEIALSPATG